MLLLKASGKYEQTESMKLPMKWMALESLTSRIFSEKTDVWSTGVIMWEVFAYGVIPYTGVRNAEIIGRLKDGARLSRSACRSTRAALHEGRTPPPRGGGLGGSQILFLNYYYNTDVRLILMVFFNRHSKGRRAAQ